MLPKYTYIYIYIYTYDFPTVCLFSLFLQLCFQVYHIYAMICFFFFFFFFADFHATIITLYCQTSISFWSFILFIVFTGVRCFIRVLKKISDTKECHLSEALVSLACEYSLTNMNNTSIHNHETWPGVIQFIPKCLKMFRIGCLSKSIYRYVIGSYFPMTTLLKPPL